jgi:hypothetical protein
VNRISLAVILLFVASGTASSQCVQLFSALSINGNQYSVQPDHNFVPFVVSETISLNLQFRAISEPVAPVTGVTLRYTVDNQPVSPALTDNFAWNLDTTKIADGTHSISVLYVDEPPPGDRCNTFSGRQYTFVVSNSGSASTSLTNTGAQRVPLILPPQGNGPVAPQYADFINYPGYHAHPAAHPFSYQFIPAAGGVPPTDLWIEPLIHSTSNAGEGEPAYWQLRNGSIVEDPLFPEVFFCDDLRKPRFPFDVTGPLWEQRKSRFDGQQDDATMASYAVFTPNLDGPGFYGVGMDGRLVMLGMDGSVKTLAGWVANRSTTPFHYLDSSIPMSAVRRQQSLVGSFDVPFTFPTDLAIDPNNHSHIFVADMNNHRIALVDLSQSPPVISTYAGTPGVSGYLDGPALSSLFNQPSSIAIAADETIYVADAENSAIRKIDPLGKVSTLVGFGPLVEPANNIAANSPLTYAPLGAVPFNSAYINYPNVLRFDSKGNLVVGETVTQTIRYIDLNAQTVNTIARFSQVGNSYGEQLWLDVDRKGNIGGRDDIIATLVSARQNGLYRIPITGTLSVPLPMLTNHSTSPVYSGHTLQSSMPWTSAPWSVAIDDQEGRLVVTGVHSSGVVSLRLLQPGDPKYQLSLPNYVAGRNIWFTGTVPNFPFGSRPSFAAIHGYEGHSSLGNVLNFDDMVAMTDAQLGAYVQAGAEGSVPRPELTGNDLRNVIYYIRRTATGGASVTPGQGNTDTTGPVISLVSGSQVDGTDATVNWTTSEPSLGFVAWGTSSGTYFGWSPIESDYSTNHLVTLSNLPAGDTIYFVVRAKDQAGNQRVSTEQSLNLR